MNFTRKLIFTAALAALPIAALAQDTANMIDSNGDQQRRIEQGLRSGDLTVQEAARLEGEAARVYRLQSQALRDGTLSDAERARIANAQNHLSQDIARERHDDDRGDPNSASSRRMQANVQRNVNQQERIEQGIRSGDLTNREVSRLEQGQARNSRLEARAGADGRIDRNEQRHIQGADHRQSRQIYGERHDDQFRRGGDHRPSYNNYRDDRFRRDGDHRQSYNNHRDDQFRRDGDHRQSYDHRRDAQAPRGSEHRQAWGNQRDVQVPRAGDNRQSNGNPRDVQAPRGGDNRQASGVRQNGDFRGGTQPRAQQQPRVQPQQPRHVAQAGGGRTAR